MQGVKNHIRGHVLPLEVVAKQCDCSKILSSPSYLGTLRPLHRRHWGSGGTGGEAAGRLLSP